jgi:trigger factor
MEVSVEAGAGLERVMRVQVPEERISTEVDKRLQDMVRQVRLPGFRPGKVPRKVVNQRFGRQVRDEVMGEVLQSSFYEALTQENLRPAGAPRIEPEEGAGEGASGLAYTATFDVYPEVELPDFATLEIGRPTSEVAEANVDSMIETLRKQRTRWTEVDRAATEADRVVIDFEGFIDGEPVENASATELPMELSAKRMISGFESGLVGIGPGEDRELSLSFPEAYHASELAGKPVVFAVKCHRVEEASLPEVDEEFAASFGVTEGGIEALREEVRSNMQRELSEALRTMTKKRVMDALMKDRELELPQALVQEETARALDRRKTELSHSGIDPEAAGLDAAMFEEDARTRVTLGLVLSELIKEHELKPDPARVRERIESIASTYEQPEQVIGWYYGNRDRLGDIETSVLEDQVVDWILERANVSEEAIDFDEISSGGAL